MRTIVMGAVEAEASSVTSTTARVWKGEAMYITWRNEVQTRRTALRLSALGATLVLALSGVVHAEYLGGRTATMGGAATAFGTDSAMPWINPAGLAGIPTSVAAVSASAYEYRVLQLSPLFYPSDTDPYFGAPLTTEQRITTGEVSTSPTSVMFGTHYGGNDGIPHQYLALSLVVSERRSQRFTGNATRTFVGGARDDSTADSVRQGKTYRLGPSYGVALGRVRLGASFFGEYSDYFGSNQMSRNTIGVNSSYQFQNQLDSSWSGRHFALQALAGAQVRISEESWVGLSVSMPSVSLGGQETGLSSIRSTYSDNGLNTNLTTSRRSDSRFHDAEVVRARVGYGEEVANNYAFALDVAAVIPLSGGDVVTRTENSAFGRGITQRAYSVVTKGAYATDVDPRFEVAGGAERWVSSSTALRLGCSYATRDLLFETGALDRIGVTTGVAVTTGPFESTFGLYYDHYFGTVSTRDLTSEEAWKTGYSMAMRDVSLDVVGIVLSGAVSIAEAKDEMTRALPGRVGSALELPTLPVPAPETPQPPVQSKPGTDAKTPRERTTAEPEPASQECVPGEEGCPGDEEQGGRR